MSLLKTEPALLVDAAGHTVVADVVAAFFRNRKWIMLATLAFIALVSTMIWLDHKTYESRLLFLVRDEALPSDSFANHGELQSGPASDTQVGTEIELLSNLDLHRQVISALKPGISQEAADKELLRLDKLLQVLPVPKTSLITVSYTASSEQAAKDTLSTLSRLYLDYRSEIRGSDGAYKFFDEQTAKYYALLQNDQARLADFNKKYQITAIGEEKDVTIHRLADARAALYENEASLEEAQKRIQTMTAARQDYAPRVVTQRRDIPDQVGIGHMDSQLIDLQNERVALLNKYHPTDRHVLEVDEKIANLTAALKRAQETKSTEEQSDINPLRQTVDNDLEQARFREAGLQARERTLTDQANAYGAKLEELNQVTAQNDDLTRKIREDEQDYELYSGKREAARINKTLDGDKIANVRLVSGPSLVPHARSQFIFSVACVYLIGALLIAGLGVLAGLWSPRFYSPRELEAAVGVPVWATIPLLPDAEEQREKAEVAIASSAGRRSPQPPSMGPSLMLTTGHVSQSAWPYAQVDRYTANVHNEGEQHGGVYLSLIEKMRRNGSQMPGVGSVFAFTSCNQGEGVSHFVRCLGAELTEFTGKRVAIIDALDSRESIGEYTELSPADVRSGRSKGGEDFLRQWVQRLRTAHDFVLIDCPALSTSHVAGVFGPLSDGMLLIVEAGKATRSQLRGGMAMLSVGSVSVMGLALNKRRYPVPAAIYNLF